MGFSLGAGERIDVNNVNGLTAVRLMTRGVSFVGVSLGVVLVMIVCGQPAQAQTSAKSKVQILRGTVLPQKKAKFAMPTANSWLAALRRPAAPNAAKLGMKVTSARRTVAGGAKIVAVQAALKTRAALKTPAQLKFVERLDFSSFRRGFKPPAAVARPTVRLRYASLGAIRLPQAKSRNRVTKPASRFVKWLAYPGCVPRPLKKILDTVARRFGSLTVNSTHRSVRHNREVGGAKHSFHLKCQAVDFRIRRNIRATVAFLKGQTQIGGLKHYGGGRFHIDTGPRRTW